MTGIPTPERLTLTAYLSGKRKSRQWHLEQDSVAARIVITSSGLIWRILEELDFEDDDKQARWQYIEIVADAASDDENQAVLDFLREANQYTSYIHIDEGDTTLT